MNPTVFGAGTQVRLARPGQTLRTSPVAANSANAARHIIVRFGVSGRRKFRLNARSAATRLSLYKAPFLARTRNRKQPSARVNQPARLSPLKL
jgi:hypothetical protein